MFLMFLKLEVLKWDVWFVFTHLGINSYGFFMFFNSSKIDKDLPEEKSNNSGIHLTFWNIYLYDS